MTVDGELLVRRSVAAVLGDRDARPVIVVTGHQADDFALGVGADYRSVLCTIRVIAEGLSTSLRAGLDAVPAGRAEGVLVRASATCSVWRLRAGAHRGR